MDKLALRLEPRTVVGKHVKYLRAQGLVPASTCGKGIASENFVTDAKIFSRIYQRAGKTGLIELQTPQGLLQGFIRQVQKHPISNVWLHVDFHVVDTRIPIIASIPVAAFGDNPLITRDGGLLTMIVQSVQVKALPFDLPQGLEIDISGVEDYNTTLHVSDIQLPPNVELITSPDEPLLTINPSTTATEEAAITEQEQLGEPELTGDAAPMDIEDPAKAVKGAEDASTQSEQAQS